MVLKMLPNKAADAAVLWDGLKGTIGGLVSCCRTTDGDIVDIGNCVLGNLQLKDVHYVIVEDGDSISPTHGEFGEMKGAVWHLESGVVTRCFGKQVFAVSNIQVEHSSTGMTCKLLGDLFGEGRDARMLDGDSVKGFKTVDRVNGISFFLHDAEPV